MQKRYFIAGIFAGVALISSLGANYWIDGVKQGGGGGSSSWGDQYELVVGTGQWNPSLDDAPTGANNAEFGYAEDGNGILVSNETTTQSHGARAEIRIPGLAGSLTDIKVAYYVSATNAFAISLNAGALSKTITPTASNTWEFVEYDSTDLTDASFTTITETNGFFAMTVEQYVKDGTNYLPRVSAKWAD